MSHTFKETEKYIERLESERDQFQKLFEDAHKRIEELQEELDSGGHKFQVVAAELDFCRANLQRYRELAEKVDILDHPNIVMSDALQHAGELALRRQWEGVHKLARELLKED